MATTRRTRIGGLAVCCAVVMALGASPASATKLVEITLETDKEVYEVTEEIGVFLTFYNAGDEEISVGQTYYHDAVLISLFENPSWTGRDDLLGQAEPLRSHPTHFCFFGLYPSETYSYSWPEFLFGGDDEPLDPGQYTFVAHEGPDSWAWEDVAVDYSNAVANITIVPEPGTLCLVLGAAVTVLRARTRRRK